MNVNRVVWLWQHNKATTKTDTDNEHKNAFSQAEKI